MKYSLDLGDAILLVGGGRLRQPYHVKPDQVGPDALLGVALLILGILFFVFWFGARLRRASKGDLGKKWSP